MVKPYIKSDQGQTIKFKSRDFVSALATEYKNKIGQYLLNGK